VGRHHDESPKGPADYVPYKPPYQSEAEGAVSFLSGREGETPPEVFSLREGGNGWSGARGPKQVPLLPYRKANLTGERGMYDTMEAVGHMRLSGAPEHEHELRKHGRQHIEQVFRPTSQVCRPEKRCPDSAGPHFEKLPGDL